MLSTYVTKRRLSRSYIQYRSNLHMLRREDSFDQIYKTDPIYICYREKIQSLKYTIPGLIYICYDEKTQSISYTIPTLSAYINHEKSQSIRYTIPTLSTFVTMRRLSQSDIQYGLYLHMLPREDSVNQIYNTDPIYICYHEQSQSIRYTIPTLSTYITHEKTQSIRYTIPTLSTYITMRRLRSSDIQYRLYLYIFPLGWLSRSDIQHRLYLHMLPKEDSVNQIYKTDPTYICHDAKTQSIRYAILTLSTNVWMRGRGQSNIKYRPYLHMLPW